MSNITIRKHLSPLELSKKYFELIGCINNIPITKGEAELLAYMNNFGFPKTREQKQRYFQATNKSEPTLNNLIFFLKKKKFLVKEDRQIKINPQLTKPNVTESLELNIIIENDSQ